MKFRSRLIVNLHYLKENFQSLKIQAPNTNTLFMVKADGYGHGAAAIVRYAFEELGIKEFGCAAIHEAIYLRAELPNLSFDIYVFSDLQLSSPESIEIYSNQRIFPVLSSLEQLDFFLHQEDFKYFPICLKFNTGMNRLGIDSESVPVLVKKLLQHKRNSIFHLFTHLANSSLSMTENQFNIDQQEKFKQIKESILSSNITIRNSSIANSGAIMQKSGVDQTHIRPGIMLYTHPKCISRLETTVLQVFDVKKDTPIGYNSELSPRDGVVVVLAIGYGDGFSTRYSGSHINHRGISGEIIGRINMDMTFVLFPLNAKSKILPNDVVTIWGENEGDLLKFSTETKTIPYELLCALLPRIPRIYRLN